LADPIVGGTLARMGTGFADSTSGSIAHNLQLALLIAGIVIYRAVSMLAARTLVRAGAAGGASRVYWGR
jgi:hypothetical protein